MFQVELWLARGLHSIQNLRLCFSIHRVEVVVAGGIARIRSIIHRPQAAILRNVRWGLPGFRVFQNPVFSAINIVNFAFIAKSVSRQRADLNLECPARALDRAKTSDGRSHPA